ncbi:MAG: family 16 glycoside hydrolase [Candidatus Omnitrophota bacterium]
MLKARIGIFIVLPLFIGAVSACAVDYGFNSIFNGKDLSGWDGDPQFWTVEDGAITGRTTADNPAKENTFIFWRQGELDDFELHLSFRLINGNSGIQIRSRELEKWKAAGYQADMESSGGWMGALYDEHGRGPLATRGQKTVINEKGEKQPEQVSDPAELLAAVKKDDWNEYDVIAQGPHLIQKINGRVMSEVIDNDAKSVRSGKLALQIHVGPPMTVQFKDIRLKRLPLQDKKKIVLVAGKQSHGHGEHEHNAGVLLLKSCLDQLPSTINANYHDGWPSDPTAFDNADSIMIFMDGGGGHPMIRGDGLRQIGERMKKGAGLAVIHYAVEVPSDRGGAEMLNWIGGYYETGVSTNPIWTADFKSLPDHPVARGVKPFALRDEWYFNIHFRPDKKCVVPLLKAVPPDSIRGTEAAKAHPGREEVVSWCVEQPDGGRGFGFTGGHYHKNWGDDNFRKLVLNALYWTAHVEVPPDGVPSTVTPEQLGKNLDNDRER